MAMWSCFVSYSWQDRQKVESFVGLHRTIFGEQVDFWIDRDKIPLGKSIDHEIKKGIERCRLLLLFASSNSLTSPEIHKEYKKAKALGKDIGVVFIDHSRKDSLGIFDKRLLRDLYADCADATNLDSVQKVVESIQKLYACTMLGDMSLIETTEKLVDDVVATTGSELSLFLIDGGTTIRHLLGDSGRVESLLSRGRLTMRFLYVEPSFRDFVARSPTATGHPEILRLSEDVYSELYEALLESSMMIHAAGRRRQDICESIDRLRELSARGPNVTVDIRKTSQLPVHRMIFNENYLYRTHFMLTVSGFRLAAPDYYTLKLKKGTDMYRISKAYFHHLFDHAAVVQ